MDDEDRDALAAEYVLGTLSAEEREQAEALLALDSGFAAIVRVWEHRLGELNVMVEAVEPPPDLWHKIKTEIDSAQHGNLTIVSSAASIEELAPQAVPTAPLQGEPEDVPEPSLDLVPDLVPDLLSEQPKDASDQPKDPDSSEATTADLDEAALVNALASTLLPETPAANFGRSPPPPSTAAMPEIASDAEILALRQGVRRWRGLALATGAIAALLAAYVGIAQLTPRLIPLGRQSQPALAAAPKPAPGSRLVAVLQQEPTAPAFLLTLDPQERTMTVRRLTAAPDSGRSYELWLFSSKLPKPTSLGAVGADEFTRRPIPANVDLDAMRSASYGVSLEPAGGSQSGAPRGPMLFRGRMVEALPGSSG